MQTCACPSCRSTFRVPADIVGKEVSCPKCRDRLFARAVGGKTVLALAGVSGDGTTQALDAPAGGLAKLPTRPARAGGKASEPSRGFPWLSVVVSVLGLAFFVCAGVGTVAILWLARTPPAKSPDALPQARAELDAPAENRSERPPAQAEPAPKPPAPAAPTPTPDAAPREAKAPTPERRAVPSFTVPELLAAWAASPAEFMDQHSGKTIRIAGDFRSAARDDGVTPDTYLYFQVSPEKQANLTVRFANPYVPDSLKPGQQIAFTGRVETRMVRGRVSGFLLNDCRLIK